MGSHLFYHTSCCNVLPGILYVAFITKMAKLAEHIVKYRKSLKKV